jgi:hypothetical protein
MSQRRRTAALGLVFSFAISSAHSFSGLARKRINDGADISGHSLAFRAWTISPLPGIITT